MVGDAAGGDRGDDLDHPIVPEITLTPATVGLRDVVAACIVAAEVAGDEIRRLRTSTEWEVEWKAPGSPVTSADTAAEALILGVLRDRLGGGLTIIGEEGEQARSPAPEQLPGEPDLGELPDAELPRDRLTFYVDPLDATGSFVRGRLHRVTVLIGVALRGKAHIGIVHHPWHEGPGESTAWGVVGWGVRGQQVVRLPTEPVVLLTSKSHMNTRLRRRTEQIGATDVLLDSGSGHKGRRLLAGDANVYAYPVHGYKLWDACAVDALIHAAGGHYTDRFGHRLHYGPGHSVQAEDGIVATLQDAEFHERMTAAMRGR